MEGRERIRALFLDIGGVLLTNGWGQEERGKAAEAFHLDLDDMNERHHLTFDTYEEGKLSLDEYLNRTVFYVERPYTRDDFKTFMFSLSTAYPGMIDLVRTLKARHGLKVAVVSNEGRELTEHRIRTFKLGEFVDFFVSSCFVHIRKPDEDIFRVALDIAQVPAGQVAYIEDRLMFVEVARRLGIQGIHHRGLDTTRAALAQAGLAAQEGESR